MWAGRWLSADPAGTVDGINIYQMVNNNPIVLSDDSGLFSFKWWGISPEKRANLSYQRMAEGELWSGFSDYASFLQRAKQNLKDIKSANKILSPEAAGFINRFQRIDFNLVHFSNADLSKGVFYSRVELEKKKIIFNELNSTPVDISQLKTDDFSFFSLEVVGAKGKLTSALGGNKYEIPLRETVNYKYMNYAHVAINDTLLFDVRHKKTGLERQLALLKNKSDINFLNRKKIAKAANQTVFDIKDLKEGLAYRIVNSAKNLYAEGQKKRLSARTPQEFDLVLSVMYRPQVLVPKKFVSKHVQRTMTQNAGA
ncbi:RHS repeat-associated core domain-containing protein [Enterobacter sp. R4-368]|uniref:RHS repeat-associated core domain-containing protein n=1 Tax=Enterobacter sp. R4-368 TaxID=1166130 RepID=UPI000D724D1A|nr:RHS repeat-associated core domain-containing protein [Enterobacter sp. R4-368]